MVIYLPGLGYSGPTLGSLIPLAAETLEPLLSSKERMSPTCSLITPQTPDLPSILERYPLGFFPATFVASG